MTARELAKTTRRSNRAREEHGQSSILQASSTPVTVTLKHLAAAIAAKKGVSKKIAEGTLKDLVGLVVKHLKKGDRVRMRGLGVLQVRKHAARTGRNPTTGEMIKIKARKHIAFRPAKELVRQQPTTPDIHSDEFAAALLSAFNSATAEAVRAHFAAGQRVFASVDGIGKFVSSIDELRPHKKK